MPALPSVPGVLRFDHFFDIGTDTNAKVRSFWKYLGGPPTNAELNTVATAARLAFASDLASVLFHLWSLTRIIVTDLTSPTAAIGEDSTAVPGTRTGTENPGDICVLRSKHVARRYRGGHPREYWPFGQAGDTDDAQHWSSTLVGEVDTGLTDYDAAIQAAIGVWGTGQQPVNVSYYENFTVHTGTTGRARNISTPRVTPIVDLVVDFTVQHGIASQRKRLLRLA